MPPAYPGFLHPSQQGWKGTRVVVVRTEVSPPNNEPFPDRLSLSGMDLPRTEGHKKRLHRTPLLLWFGWFDMSKRRLLP